MDYSFPHYLLSKQTVDDRALNRGVLDALRTNLPANPIRIIEVGAGIGTMLRRLVRWDILREAEYVLVDEMAENIEYAREWLPEWAGKTGLSTDKGGNSVRVYDEAREITVRFECADVFRFIQKNQNPADLLIAHAFLDLLPMPESLPKLLSLTRSLAWLTINFDGMTTFEPTIDTQFETQIERLYHETMDTRPTGGNSRAGRHLFEHLRTEDALVLAAGASDWVVYALNGTYPADEKYFLQFILHFFEESLSEHPELDAAAFADWLTKRRTQIERGQLVYIAHQMDFLVKRDKNISV